MRQHARQPARVHYEGVQLAVSKWYRSKSRSEAALADASRHLREWLNDYPGQSADIQRIALSACYAAHLAGSPATADLAAAGLDAALIRAPKSESDRVSVCLLAVVGAAAFLDRSDSVAGQQLLEVADGAMRTLAPESDVRMYLDLQRYRLRGAFAEAALETESAAENYEQSVRTGRLLLEDESRLEALARACAEELFGDVSLVLADGKKQSMLLLRSDIEDVYRSAVLGWSKTAAQPALEAARLALDACRRFGLPGDLTTLSLRPALESLPLEEMKSAVDEVIALAGQFKDQNRASAWRAMAKSTLAHALFPVSEEASHAAFGECGIDLVRTNDALTVAKCFGDLLTARRGPLEFPADEGIVRSLVSVYYYAAARVRGTPLYLPFRAEFDAPIATAVEWAFEAFSKQPSVRAGALLSTLLDALRSPELDLTESPGKDPDPALELAVDRIERLAFAVSRTPDTTALLIQSVRDSTLFLCATCNPSEPLILERAGPDYQLAASALAREFRNSLEPGYSGGKDKLTQLGKAAFNALPPGTRGAVKLRGTLLLAPDFRSDQEGVPFELFHDGSGFVGLRKLVSRFLSAREMLRVVEPPVARPPLYKRAVCIGAARVRGYPELSYADWELGEIRSVFKDENWEVPDLPQAQISPEVLLDAAEASSMLHVAAHGERYAAGEAVVLSHDRRLTIADIENKPQMLRSCVFLNTCSLGASRYLGGGVSRGIAYALVRAHAPCVVANLLPVYDRSASVLGIEFYDHATHESVGEALRLARVRLDEQGFSPEHWASTVLIGDPWHVLPAKEAEVTNRREDAVTNLLDAYTRFKHDATASMTAYRTALQELEKNAGNVRLRAARAWVDRTTELDPAKHFDPEEAERMARLAREIEHPAGEAILRVSLARTTKPGDRERDAAELDGAIRAVEAVASTSDEWRRILLDLLARRQRLELLKEPEPIILSSGLRVNDQSDPAIRAVFQIQHAVDRDSIRRGRGVSVRRVEQSLEDVAWNAIVIGQKDRFVDPNAHAEFAIQMAGKLALMGLIPANAELNTRRLILGFLPFLWSTQRITHLEYERATGQAAALRLLLMSAAEQWTPPESSPAFPHVSVVANQLEELVSARRREGSSKFAIALRALEGESDDDDALAQFGKMASNSIAACSKKADQARSDGAAWVLGLIAERAHELAIDRNEVEQETGAVLWQQHDGLLLSAEGWFAYYLFAGYGATPTARPLVFEKWRAAGG
jgi:hypothetical protein